MITALRPFRMGADGDINPVWMESLGSENIIDVVASVGPMVEIKGVVRFLAMFTLALMVVKAIKPALPKQRDEVAELVSPRWFVPDEVGVKIACPDHFRSVNGRFIELESF